MVLAGLSCRRMVAILVGIGSAAPGKRLVIRTSVMRYSNYGQGAARGGQATAMLVVAMARLPLVSQARQATVALDACP
ncbi:hypothetical protein GCK32_003354 [Trichostrongylus colubriformis]|uniref:Uncharacterized protein n=1 Tax=Trichostrongylus colubriformis TaxID=6319 RepID=A0AAN8F643_TRICO